MLGQFHDTGLIDDATYAVRVQATARHGGERDSCRAIVFRRFSISCAGRSTKDYPDAELNSAGLSIHTTLAPSVQTLGEDSIDKALTALGKRGAASMPRSS